ncbi:hypothetical protein AX15_003303 [Amanita polypyramis BW_CC]|nr:hypothetical protein AX15_003303 [Amanita polypyramis BW_CC]
MRIYPLANQLGVLIPKHWARFGISLLFCSTSFAYDRTNEAGEAAIQVGVAECQPYGYPAVTNSLSSFPPIWQAASILPNDSEALNRWNSIAGGIPNIPPKGTIDGNFSKTFPAYPKNDPDCWWTYGQCVTPKLQTLPPDVYKLPEPRTLGYGFDDGPNCSHSVFYDYLSSHDQKATMFYIGSNVMNWPLEAQRAVADGHEVCVRKHLVASLHDRFPQPKCICGALLHCNLLFSYSHSNSCELQIKAIELVMGTTPNCWRPPFGDVDDRIRSIATGLGLRTILWGYDSNDWRVGVGGVTAANVDGNYQQLINEVDSGQFNNAGVIILTHELNNFTMSEAIKFYPQLRAAFQSIVPVGVALNQTSYPNNFTLSALTEMRATPPGTTTVPRPTTTTTITATSSTNHTTGTPASMKNGATNPHYPILSPLLPILLGISLTF